MSDYKELLRDYIIDNFLFGDGDKLGNETLLFEKGIIDSTGVLELLAFIEENFKIKVKDEELVQSNFSSISTIEKFIQYKNNNN